MEDFEAIVSPFAMSARRQKQQDQLSQLELTELEKIDLVRFASSQAYETFLKLMEGEVIKAETEHFRIWKDDALFRSTGLVAVAQRLLFERLQKTIKHHSEELKGEIDREQFEAEIKKKTPAELLSNSI